jgi:hypothetical protein
MNQPREFLVMKEHILQKSNEHKDSAQVQHKAAEIVKDFSIKLDFKKQSFIMDLAWSEKH